MPSDGAAIVIVLHVSQAWEVQELCHDIDGFWTWSLQQEVETDDVQEIMGESFSSAQNILFIDYSEKLSAHWTKHDLIALDILCLYLASVCTLILISCLEVSQVCCLSCLTWLLLVVFLGLCQDLVVPGVKPLLEGDHQDQIHQGRSKTGKRQGPWD